jgi:methyl-accepting chemotaxis protein
MGDRVKSNDVLSWFHQVRSEVTLYWLGASAGAIAADLVFCRMASQQHNVTLVWALTCVIILIVILAGLIQLRFRVLFRPIQTLYDEMMKMQTGDFGERDLHASGSSDLAQVVRAMQDAKSSVRAILEQMKQASSEITASIEALHEGAQQTSQASEQNASAMMDVMASVEQQRSLTNRTVAAMERTVESVDSIRSLSDEAQRVSATMMDKAQQGKAEMTATTEQMQEIEREVESMLAHTSELERSAAQVSEIIQAIQSIASETNLLALNAAVEAAHAGENGKGFAVVAAEVRKLADQSRHDSIRIKDVVTSMVEHVQASMESMQSVAAKVAKGSVAVQTTGGTLLNMVQDLVGLQKRVQQIQSASQEIGRQAQEVVQLMQSLAEAADKQSEAIATVAAASEEQLAMMEEVTSTASAMNDMAARLRSAALRFTW